MAATSMAVEMLKLLLLLLLLLLLEGTGLWLKMGSRGRWRFS